MYVAVSSSMLQYLLHVAVLRSPTTCRLAQPFLVCSSYAAVSTLAGVVFPDRASRFLYVIFGLLSAGKVLHIFGNKLVIEELDVDVDVDVDVDEDEDEEEESPKFGMYRRRVGRFLKNICSRIVAKFLGKQPQPILPI